LLQKSRDATLDFETVNVDVTFWQFIVALAFAPVYSCAGIGLFLAYNVVLPSLLTTDKYRFISMDSHLFVH